MYNIVKNQNEIMLAIKHYMLDNNIKQKDIVTATGLSKQTVSNIFNGHSKNITLATLFNIINALNCNLSISLNNNIADTDKTNKDN